MSFYTYDCTCSKNCKDPNHVIRIPRQGPPFDPDPFKLQVDMILGDQSGAKRTSSIGFPDMPPRSLPYPNPIWKSADESLRVKEDSTCQSCPEHVLKSLKELKVAKLYDFFNEEGFAADTIEHKKVCGKHTKPVEKADGPSASKSFAKKKAASTGFVTSEGQRSQEFGQSSLIQGIPQDMLTAYLEAPVVHDLNKPHVRDRRPLIKFLTDYADFLKAEQTAEDLQAELYLRQTQQAAKTKSDAKDKESPTEDID